MFIQQEDFQLVKGISFMCEEQLSEGTTLIGTTSMEALRCPITARLLSGFTLFFFTFVFYLSPFGLAVAQEVDNTPESIVLTGSPAQKMNQGLLKVQEIAAKKHAKIAQRMEDESTFINGVLDFLGLSLLTLEDVAQL